MILRERVSINTTWWLSHPLWNIFAKIGSSFHSFWGEKFFENKNIFEIPLPPLKCHVFYAQENRAALKNDLIYNFLRDDAGLSHQSRGPPINPDQSISTVQEIRPKKGELSGITLGGCATNPWDSPSFFMGKRPQLIPIPHHNSTVFVKNPWKFPEIEGCASARLSMKWQSFGKLPALTLREQVLTFAEKDKRSRTNALFFRVEVMLKCGFLQEGNHKQNGVSKGGSILTTNINNWGFLM